jgi:hypothetical protein
LAGESRKISVAAGVAKASQGPRQPMTSSPPAPSAVSTRPPANAAGPRQNSPPYPAFSRPSVVGLPIATARPLTLRIAVVKPSVQAAPSGRTVAVSPRRSVNSVWPAAVTQVSRSSRRARPSREPRGPKPSWRMRPLLSSWM